MPSATTLSPSEDTTGAADTAAINTALGSVGAGGSVLLGPGDWYTGAPLKIPAGVELAGIKGGINGGTAWIMGSCLMPGRRTCTATTTACSAHTDGGRR